MAKKIVAYLGDFPIPYPYVEADVDSASSGEDVLTLHPMSCNTYTATDVDILVEGVHLAAIAGTVRELLLVIDCTDLEEVPELSFSEEFDMFEGGDSSAVALSPGTYNVYRVIEYLPGHFSVYAGMSPAAVTGVKGAAESSYRIGNVNLTPENIGAISQAALDSKSFIKSPDGNTRVDAVNGGAATISFNGLGNATVNFPDGFSISDDYVAYMAPSGGESIEFFGPITSTAQPSYIYWVPEAYKDVTDFDPQNQTVWCLYSSSGAHTPGALMFASGPYYSILDWESIYPGLTISWGEASGDPPRMSRTQISDTKAIATADQIPSVVAPSTSSADSGKAADAKATGDALADKLDKSSETWNVSYTDGGGLRIADTAGMYYIEINPGHIRTNYPDAHNVYWPINGGTTALLENLAGNFSSSTAYAKDALVVYMSALYRCINPNGHTGAWVAADFAVATVEDVLAALRASKTDASVIADEFSTSKTYAVDEAVMHQGVRYRCTTAVTTAGAWTGSANWTAETVQEAIEAGGGGGGTQVQANWNETDTTSPAYIQNKPTIPSDKPTRIYNEVGTDALDDKGQLFKSSLQGNYWMVGSYKYTYAGYSESVYKWQYQDNFNEIRYNPSNGKIIERYNSGYWNERERGTVTPGLNPANGDTIPSLPGVTFRYATGATFTPLATTMETTSYAHFSLESLPDRTWAAGVWAVGDLVKYSDKAYRCKAATTASDTTAPSSDTTHWTEIPTLDGISATLGDIETALHAINNGSST